ncbi:MAG: hypothetical protein U9R53_07395 [Chloroflexota bacterium]|nr:hypothetical protein [Chloroflexota bacterium]
MDLLTFNRNGPKAFIIARDGSFSPIDPLEDQVWAFSFSDSKTHPFHLETTYGLRARSMRLFPNIIMNNKRLTYEVDFNKAPMITRYTPSQLRIKFSLLNGVDIQLDFFVPEINALAGGFDIANRSAEPISLTLELAAILVPMDKGVPIHPEKVGINQILEGQTGELWPVLFMTGGPMAISNPYPALSLPILISPEETRRLTWSLVTKNSQTESFESARRITAAPWRETAQDQFMKHNSQTIHIRTGVPDWDAAFYLAQMNAMTHVMTRDSNNPLIFIRTRLPDKAIPEGRSFANQDNLTILELMHLAQVILPPNYKALRSHLNAYLDRVKENDQLSLHSDGKALSKTFRECPLLAQLCLEIYEIEEDREFLKNIFPTLIRLFRSWYSHPVGSDKHAPLNWDNPRQLALDTGMFTFDIWEATGQGLDIRFVESPALAAMLFREARALRKIADILGDKPQLQSFGKIESIVKEKMQSFWQDDQHTWSYQDRQSHLSPTRELFYPGPARESIEIHKVFTVSQRLQCHLYAREEGTRNSHIIIRGKAPGGEEIIENFTPTDIRWFAGRAHVTTENLYSVLHSISLKGMQPNDRFLIETANLSQSDITCLAPIWAGGVSNERLESLLDNQLNWQDPSLEYGIPETWKYHHALPEDLPIRVNVLWNTMIIEGLVECGYPEPAMRLFTNLMMTIVQGLKQFEGFFPFYDCDTGRPVGQRNTISGLVPLRLFLQIAGIRLINPNKIAIWGTSPFPWPIEVSWQGLMLRREGPKIDIIFPDGTTYKSESDQPVLLTSGSSRI